MHEDELRDAFRIAVDNYQAAKDSCQCEIQAYIDLLLAERALIRWIVGAPPFEAPETIDG